MAAKARGIGRPGALDEARSLVALVSSLSEAGDALSTSAVAERLGVSGEEADKLVELVLSSTLEDGVGLPLVDEGGELTLVSSGGVRGRRLRLTRDETLALASALERLGVPEDDPLRRTLDESLSAEAIDADLVRALMAGAEGSETLSATLSACGHAAAERRELFFLYAKPGGSQPEQRRVVPRSLRADDGTWLLDAYDVDRRGERSFRLDRMSGVSLGAAAPARDARREAAGARTVTIAFSDPSYLTLLPWHDLRFVGSAPSGATLAETPYYGGMWLPRMIAACAGTARCNDSEVTSLVEKYVRQQLSE